MRLSRRDLIGDEVQHAAFLPQGFDGRGNFVGAALDEQLAKQAVGAAFGGDRAPLRVKLKV